MNSNTWAAVDDFFSSALHPPDERLAQALRDAADAGLPEIHVAPNQGKLLYLLALAAGARRVLELGTLAGYSTIWLARANLARAGVLDLVKIMVGPALDTLDALIARAPRDSAPPFDFAFIDADKPNLPAYFGRCLRLVRPGGLIVADNVVRNGAVIDPDSDDPGVLGVRGLLDLIAQRASVEACVIQTVGAKGYDGALIARVAS